MLITTLAHAVACARTPTFHSYQMLEAGVQQYRGWGESDEGRHILIAVARYLAAHSPTERAQLQTAMVARRLGLGQALYEEAGHDLTGDASPSRRAVTSPLGIGKGEPLSLVERARQTGFASKRRRLHVTFAVCPDGHWFDAGVTSEALGIRRSVPRPHPVLLRDRNTVQTRIAISSRFNRMQNPG